MADILINHPAMQAAASDLAGDANYLQNVLDDLDAQIQKLVSSWEGDAQQAYLVAKKNWTQAMTDIKMTLTSISQLLDATDAEFTRIDRQGAALFT